MRPRALAAAAALLLGLALAAPPAAAHRNWQPAEQLTDDGLTGMIDDVVVTPQGDVVAAYNQETGWSSPGGGPFVAIKRPGLPVARYPFSGGVPVRLGVDGAGNTVAAHYTWDGVQVARRAPGGLFDPAEVTVPDSKSSNVTQLVANARGDVAIVLRSWDDDNNYSIRAAFGTTTGGFDAPVVLAQRAGYMDPAAAAALTDDGELLVAWSEALDGSSGPVVLATARRGVVPPAPIEVSDGAHWPWNIRIDTSTAGDAVMWTANESAYYDHADVMVAERPPGGSFGAARALPVGMNYRSDPRYAMAGDGTITVAARDGMFSLPIGGQPTVLSSTPFGGPTGAAAVAVNRGGDFVLIRRPDWPSHAVSVHRRGAGPIDAIEDVRPDCADVEDILVAVGEDGTSAALMARRQHVSLAVDAPAAGPGRQECVSDETVYGRPPRNQPPNVYQQPGWTPPGSPPPSYSTTPLTLELGGASVDRTSTTRTLTLDLACSRKCRLEGKASLRLADGGVLTRAVAEKNSPRSGRARLKLVLRLSSGARQKAAESGRPLRLEARIVATDLVVVGQKRLVRKVSRRVR